MLTLIAIEHVLRRADEAAQLSSADISNITAFASNAFAFVTLDADGQRKFNSALQALNAYAEGRRGYGAFVMAAPRNDVLRQDAWRAYGELVELLEESPRNEAARSLGL